MKMNIFNLNLLREIKSDLVWNYISLFILGITGLILNIFISNYYDSSILGSFNQVISFYIVFGVIGSGGINFSILQSIASNLENKKIIKDIISGGLILTTILSSTVTLVFILLINPISYFLDSEIVKTGLLYISPGLFFFSINKILLQGVINGMQRMKTFAVYQSFRYIFLLLSLSVVVLISLEGSKLTIIFSISEIILFLLLIKKISNLSKWWESRKWIIWLKKHIRYSFKSFSGGILLELNSRVDILCIGYFLSDEKVGIYSFASLFAEGFLQILIVLQNIFNPRIAVFFSNKNIKGLVNMIFKTKKLIYLFTSLFLLLVGTAYTSIINLFTNNSIYQESTLPFIILILGITIASGYIPFYNIFFMNNIPTWQSYFMITIISTNSILNILLIPRFGINGAALATSLSFILSILFFKKLVWKIIKIKV